MCPLCLTTVAWITASAAATGGISALVVGRVRGKNQHATNTSNNNQEGERHGQQ